MSEARTLRAIRRLERRIEILQFTLVACTVVLVGVFLVAVAWPGLLRPLAIAVLMGLLGVGAIGLARTLGRRVEGASLGEFSARPVEPDLPAGGDSGSDVRESRGPVAEDESFSREM